MHFSFILVVVAALTTSMSVSACTNLNGVCDSSSASNDACCSNLACNTGVSMGPLHPEFTLMAQPLRLVPIGFRLDQVLPLTLSQGAWQTGQHRSVCLLLYEFPGCLEQILENSLANSVALIKDAHVTLLAYDFP
ncbi:hypothetical protein EDB19DRAFT_1021522 [Suillus lakei]|nr:hypothetical protein EDB19DRAFT_1021522 [Suillus lakei]